MISAPVGAPRYRQRYMLARVLLPTVVAAALAGCGGGGSGGAGAPAPATAGSADPATTATATAPQPVRYRLYYLEGEHLRAAPAASDAEPTAQQVVEELVANPGGHTTAIPEATEVNGVTSGGGTAVVDLSRAFESGGGSLSMQARVAQVVFALTQFAWIERVTIRLDGEEVEAIGGEGVPARELGREGFADLLPPIFVEQPLEGDAVTSPLTVRGDARVFEANVSLRLETAAGEVFGETFATAAEGAPGRGPFRAEIAFAVDEPTAAELVAYEESADDGSEQHVVRVPVRLCPAGGC